MDLSQKLIQITVITNHEKFVSECKIDKNANLLLDVLKGLDKKNIIRIFVESECSLDCPRAFTDHIFCLHIIYYVLA